MKTFILSFLIFFSAIATAKVDSIQSTSVIKDVTVFLSGAEVTRQVNVKAGAGQYIFILDKLPLEINPQSIQVGALKGAKILSVKHELHYPRPDFDNAGRKKLESQIKDHEHRIQQIQNELDVYRIEEKLLMDNSHLGRSEESLTVAQLREAADFYRSRINEVRNARLTLHREKEDAEDSIQTLNKQINRITPVQPTAVSRILIGISTAQAISGKLKVSYYVPSAAWMPLYDFRVESTQQPLNIVYNANVYQSTGEDWKNIKLKLSTGDPSLSGTKPELHSWFLDRKREIPATSSRPRHGSLQGKVLDSETGEPIPFVNVALKDQDRVLNGTVTDIEGRYAIKPIIPGMYNLEIGGVGYQKVLVRGIIVTTNKITFQNIEMQPSTINIDEFEVMEYKVPAIDKDGGRSGGTVTRSNLTRYPGRNAVDIAGTVGGIRSVDDSPLTIDMSPDKTVVFDRKIANLEYTIDLPQTINSDGQDYLIKIKDEEAPVRYVYHAVPKLDDDVFLIAELAGWADLKLISGQSSIYYGGTFTGESFLDTEHIGDTLSISLARESNILVERISDKDFNDRRIIGSNVRETIAWEIRIKNNLGHPINMVVEDQFPLAERRSIEVELLENANAEVDPLRGKLTWKKEMSKGEELTLNHGYSIKYPSGTRLYTD